MRFAQNPNQIMDLILAEVKSPSMNPLITPGSKVPVRLMSSNNQYQADDIIVFERDGLYIIHKVEYTFESKGKTYYVTEGVNPDTNQYVDDTLVSEDDIIGIADLTEEAYSRVQELYEKGKIPTIDAYGMTQDTNYDALDSSSDIENLFENQITLPFDEVPSDISEFFDLPAITSRFNRFTQSVELIETVAKDGEYNGKGVHSIIYLIIDQYGNMHKVGRTDNSPATRKSKTLHEAKEVRERNQYPPRYVRREMTGDMISDIDAINEMYDFAYDIGGKQYAEQVIRENFMWIPLEIVFESGDTILDNDIAERTESHWMIELDLYKNPELGYNIQTGAAGPHSGMNKKTIDMLQTDILISKGYDLVDIAKEFEMSPATLSKRIVEHMKEKKLNIPIYNNPDTKNSPTAEDYKIDVLKDTLLDYYCMGYSKDKICSEFKTAKNPNGLSPSRLDYLNRIIWNSDYETLVHHSLNSV